MRLSTFVHLIIAFLLVVVAPSSDAQTPPVPQYLMPVSPMGRGYQASVERLLGHRWGHGTMIYRAYSEKDFVVSASGPDHGPKKLTCIFLEIENAQSAKATKEMEVGIDDEFDSAVREAWCAMIMKTRFPDRIPVVSDGFEVEFSAGCGYGWANSPMEGFCKELMDFGFELKNYCLVSDSERRAKRDSMIPRLKDFATRVKESHFY